MHSIPSLKRTTQEMTQDQRTVKNAVNTKTQKHHWREMNNLKSDKIVIDT